MMRASLLSACLLSLSLAAVAQTTVESIAADITEAWAQHDSVKAVIAMDALFPYSEQRLTATGTGTLEYARTGDVAKYRHHTEVTIPDPLNVQGVYDVLFDGTKLYLTNRMMGKTRSREAKPDLSDGAVPPGGAPLIEFLQATYTLTPQSSTTLDGTEVYVLEGNAPEGAELEHPKVKVYLDKEVGMLRKAELFETEDIVAITFNYTDVELNPEIDPTRFEYSAMKPEATSEVAKADAENE